MAIVLALLTSIAVADYDYSSRRLAVELYQQYWIEVGVLGETERWRYFVHPDFVEMDDFDMQCRRNAMAADCPLENDVYKLPPQEFCRRNWDIARAYRAKLEELAAYMHPTLQTAMYPQYLEQCSRERFWDLASDAAVGCGGVGRRLSLQYIRDLVGRDAYETERWPHPLIDFGQNLEWRLP